MNFVSFKFSEDHGKSLENLAFIELKRRGETIYYHRKNKECDFLIVRKNKVTVAMQVTTQLTQENRDREIKGHIEAMTEHHLTTGNILTEQQEEKTNEK